MSRLKIHDLNQELSAGKQTQELSAGKQPVENQDTSPHSQDEENEQQDNLPANDDAQLPKLLKNKLVVLSAVVLLIGISSVASYFFFKNKQQLVTEIPAETETIAAGQVKAESSEVPQDLADVKNLSVLLLGYGGPGHQGGYLSDVIQVVHVDFENALVSMISIPRDLWVQLPGGKQSKINQALTLGNDPDRLVASGAQVAKQMVSTVTGLTTNYFIAVDFVGFKRAIGINLGGIEVNVPETLEDPWYPITGEELNPCGYTPEEVAELTRQYSGFELERQFECRYESLYFEKGLNKMEGGDALKYVRSRHGSKAGDFSRSQRQHAVLKGIRNRILEREVWDDLPAFFGDVSSNVTTDLDLEILEFLAPALIKAGQFETQSIVISTENVLQASTSASGGFILIPKQGNNQWSGVHSYVQTQLTADSN